MQPCLVYQDNPVANVSILIRPEGRMQPPPPVGFPCWLGVSILIRPEGRMQPPVAEDVAAAGHDVSILIRPEGRMQPEPRNDQSPSPRVSILIRPEGRMQPRPSVESPGCHWVSILIRPEGRMQRLGSGPISPHKSFNPHPARRPDATGSCDRLTGGSHGFNPHPARRPDATTSSLPLAPL